ncbi:MAG TPA: alkaline phosphatase family protein, partial [Candidatus Tumulicola sp.]|nr:alkaline phosphatase family protein [Candidatus Tumulicola sp.]
MIRSLFRIATRLGLAPLLLCACSLPGADGTGPLSRASFEQPLRAGAVASSQTPIQHVVIIIQENRTFNDFFATYPGARGATSGKMHDGHTVKLAKVPLRDVTLSNGWQAYDVAYDGGKMDGFDLESWGGPGHAGKRPYTYVNPDQIKPYWDIARQYALGDEMFQGEGSGSFTAHQELIAGGEQISKTRALVNWPASSHPGAYAWGCDAPSGTVTSLIAQNDKYYSKQGPFPCLTYESLADQLDANHLTWRYYSGPVKPGG